MRSLTPRRRLLYALLTPVVKLILYGIWASCRIKAIQGESNIDTVVARGKPFIPCYWHQMHFFGAWYMRKLIRRGLKIGFLISPSKDGEIPARIAKSWGAEVIRGSTTRAGAQTMREMFNIVVKQGISPVTTSDGPQGPLREFKLGDILLSQFTQAPLLPLAYAASRCWQLNSWDRFIIPKPFSSIVIAVGEPQSVDKTLKGDDLEAMRRQLQNQLNHLGEQACAALTGTSPN
jgi:lysophospholipid acyltransferase (LPLAT)-like uncharacterized protein